MPTASVKPTTARNLEAKFDASEDVLDFFDVNSAKLVIPKKEMRVESKRASIGQLKRAIKITEKIEKLERELTSILGRPA